MDLNTHKYNYNILLNCAAETYYRRLFSWTTNDRRRKDIILNNCGSLYTLYYIVQTNNTCSGVVLHNILLLTRTHMLTRFYYYYRRRCCSCRTRVCMKSVYGHGRGREKRTDANCPRPFNDMKLYSTHDHIRLLIYNISAVLCSIKIKIPLTCRL